MSLTSPLSATPANPFLTIQQAALELQVAERTVRRWIKSGDLVAHRLGSLVRIDRSDLDAFLHSRRSAPIETIQYQ